VAVVPLKKENKLTLNFFNVAKLFRRVMSLLYLFIIAILSSAYSLSAWLSNNITGMYSKCPPGQIRYWDDVYNNFKVKVILTYINALEDKTYLNLLIVKVTQAIFCLHYFD